MNKAFRASVLGTILASMIAADVPAETSVVKAVKYSDLITAVRQLRGKVVIVDFWADYCIPCKREFPSLVELHRRFAKSGLAAVSVSLDENTKAKRQAVESFLKKQGAQFANYLLDELPTDWQTKLKIDGPPLVLVFNRKGELVQRFSDDAIDYDKISTLVGLLLKD